MDWNACPDDATVARIVDPGTTLADRERFLEHIGDCEPCRLLWSALQADADAREHDDPHPKRPDALEQVGRYRPEACIGIGAMGSVYRARDLLLEREVALKIFNRRTHRTALGEAKALASLRHPNVVSIYDAETEGEVPFLAMELVDGPDVDAWAQEGRTPREVIELFAGAALGLAAIHAAGLVHRDVKPSNILVGADGVARIADFGLAIKDRDTMLAGTPAYRAPELDSGSATPQSDQYAFCVSLFEVLYGRRPAGAEPRIPERPRVPRRVKEVLRRGLASTPEARFATMAEVARALSPTRTRAKIVGVFAVVATVGAVALPSMLPVEAESLCSVIGSRADGLESATAVVETRVSQWHKAHAAVCGGELPKSDQVIALRCLDEVRSRLAAAVSLAEESSEPGWAEAVSASLVPAQVCTTHPESVFVPRGEADKDLRRLLLRARTYYERGDSQRAEGLFRQALEAVGPEASGGYRVEAELGIARVMRDAGQLASAAAALEAVARAATAVAHDEVQAAALIDRAAIAVDQDPEDAARRIADAQAAVARVGAPPALRDALTLIRARDATTRGEGTAALALLEDISEPDLESELTRVSVLSELRRYDEADRRLERAGDTVAARGGEQSRAMLSVHEATVLLSMAVGETEDALEAARDGLELAERLYGTDSTHTATAQHNLGTMLLDEARYGDALRYLNAAQRTNAKHYGARSRAAMRAKEMAGLALMGQGRLTEAAGTLRAVLDELSRDYPATDLDVCGARINLAEALRRLHKPEQALEQALAVEQAALSYPPHHVLGAYASKEVGLALLELGRTAEAERKLRNAQEMFARDEYDPSDGAEAVWGLVRIASHRGDTDLASSLAQECLRILDYGGPSFAHVRAELEAWMTAQRPPTTLAFTPPSSR